MGLRNRFFINTMEKVFERCKKEARPAFIPYITAGYPRPEETSHLLLALQAGGADIIELGIPFSDPIADGPTIQSSSFEALKYNITVNDAIDMVKQARSKGLSVPVVLMSYYNPILSYGETKLVKECSKPGIEISGFIVVDMDVEDFHVFAKICKGNGLSLIPLVAPTTSDDRMREISDDASGFVYCVSLTGVTGARSLISTDISEYTQRVKKSINLPRALGFGLSTHEHFETVKREKTAEAVVMGSTVVSLLKNSFESSQSASARAKALEDFTKYIIHG